MAEQEAGPQFEAFPKILRADADGEITIRPAGGARFTPGAAYKVIHRPAERLASEAGTQRPTPSFRLEGGDMTVRSRFDGEQEHVISVQSVDGDEREAVCETRVYSVHDDLLARRPWKGDLHIHSDRSDGREPPPEVAAECRRIGLDFFALTDHRKYEPSLEAARAFEGVEIDLRIFPGEEVHAPGNPVHIVNFGGSRSVNALFAGDEAEAAWREEAAARAETVPDLPPGAGREAYASCVLCFEKIRECGGLGVFCHPYWFAGNRYDAPAPLTNALLERRPFDALEVIGGFHRGEVESNTLQVARYHEERARGGPVPVVGASDGHGCRRGCLFGWYYTVVFATACELADLIDGVKGLWSVAVEALPGESPRPHGPFRLVKYALFLLREVFPAHDALCEEEGRLMLEHVRGDAAAAGELARLAGRTGKLRDRLWAG
ncbi:MAG: PHP domain-containing protein [Planctomycetota bacterium]